MLEAAGQNSRGPGRQRNPRRDSAGFAAAFHGRLGCSRTRASQRRPDQGLSGSSNAINLRSPVDGGTGPTSSRQVILPICGVVHGHAEELSV
jgi:hypothetical protein